MKNLDRKVTLLCPLCGNDQFESLDEERLQNKVNELELKIKQNELDKIAKEKEDSALACVEARFITVGKGKHRLKVWNSGNATAYNVSARFDGDVGIMIMDREKQPFEELEARKSYELILITHNGSAFCVNSLAGFLINRTKRFVQYICNNRAIL